MKSLLLIALLFASSIVSAQVYTMPSGTGSASYTTCSGTFYDEGGAGGNYTSNEGSTITFCSGNPGQYLSIEFTMVDIESSGTTCYDELQIYYGSNTSGTLVDVVCGTPAPFSVISNTPGGCITFFFDSDFSVQEAGWEATITCVDPCVEPIASINNTAPIYLCGPEANNPDNYTVNFSGNSSTAAPGYSIDEYIWNWGDGTTTTTSNANTSHTFPGEGVYEVILQVSDNNTAWGADGCYSTNVSTQLIHITPAPDLSGTTGSPLQINCGESPDITASATTTNLIQSPVVPSGTVQLPDGTGDSYSSVINYSGFFNEGATMTSGCYPTVNFNMEHSYGGDLIIELVAPSGESVTIFDGNTVSLTTYFGSCINGADNQVEGCGADYSIVPNNSGLNWTAGNSSATNSPCAGYAGPCATGNAWNPGTYDTHNSFASLDGADLNGGWTLVITDDQSQDDGTLFSWSLDFPAACYGDLSNVNPDITTVEWTGSSAGAPAIGTETTNNTGVVDPGPDPCGVPGSCLGNTLTNTITPGPFDIEGSYTYDYLVTDEYGCEYDASVTIDVVCPPCLITWDSLYFSTVDCSNQWDGQGFIDYNGDVPTTGDLVIEDCEGNITVIASAPFPAGTSSTSGQGVIQYTFDGPAYMTSPYDCEYNVYFTADPTCESIQTMTFPALDPPDEAGTFDQNMTGFATNTYVLCDTDQFDMFSTGGIDIPSGESPGIGYLVYSCPPTPPAPGDNPGADPCLEYIIIGDAITVINDGGDADNWVVGSFNAPTNNTFYIVPMTFVDSEPTAVDGDGYFYRPDCYDLALEAMQTVQFLNPITYTDVIDCIAGTVTITLEGGHPEFYGGDFTASGLTGTTGSFDNTTAGHGGTITISGMTDGDNYSFDVVDVNGCPVTVTGTFIGQEDASFTYPNSAYCQLDADPTPTITGVPGGTFSATPGGLSINASSGVIDLSASTAGATYTVQYISPDPICNDTATFDITINPNPIIPPINEEICVGESVDLTATGADTYSWSPGTGLNTTTGATVTADPTSTQVYTITGTITATGCSNTGTATVTVNPLPTVSLGDDVAVCEGGSTTLTASGASTYTWSPGTDLSATTGSTVTSTPTGTITYTVTGTDANGCVNTDDIQVTVNPLPTVVVDDVGMCIGGSVDVTATGASTYVWSPGGGLSATTGTTVTASPGTTTNYTVTGTDANGCVNSDGFTVTVLPNAPIVASPDDVVCDGGTVNISASGGVSYTWDNSLGAGQNHDVSPTTTTVYTVTGQDAQGCVGTDQVTITVNPLPIMTDPADQTVCALTNTTDVIFSSNIGSTTYAWTNSNTLIGLAASGSGDILSFAAQNPTTSTISATITVTPTTNGCVGAPVDFTITVDPTPTVNPIADQTLCAGSPIADIIFSGAVSGTTYNWVNTNSNIGIAANGNGDITGLTATNATAGAISGTITVTPDFNGCSGTPIDFMITVNPIPTVNPINDQTICAGEATADITFTGNVTPTDYNWTNNNGLTGLAGSGTGNITSFTGINGGATQLESQVTVTPSANGCTGTPEQFSIFVNPIPTVNPVGDQTLCSGEATAPVNFSGNIATTTYNWTNSTSSIGLASAGAGTIGTFNATNNGTATVTATVQVTPSDAGCVGTPIDFDFIVNPIPTVDFIPNQTLCANELTDQVVISGPVTGSNFNWTNDTPSIGLASAGSGTINQFTAQNIGTDPVTAIITITPNANGCNGTATQFTITVNPIPTVNAVPDQELCANSATTSVTFSGNTTGTTYSWSNDNTTIGLAGSGTTTVNSFTGINNTANDVVGNITITPSANGCTGLTTSYSYTIHPTPTAVINGTVAVCEGDTDPQLTITGSNGLAPYDITYNINGSVQPVVTTIGSIATITVPSTPVGTYNYNLVSVTDANGCSNAISGTASVTVNPNPTPVINGATEYCTGTTASITTTQSFNSYDWSPNGETTQSINVTEADNPITVTVTNAYGCSATSPEFTVTENSVITYNSTIEICQGETATIHGVQQNTSGTYSQTFILPTGCDSTSAVELIVHPLPVMNAGNDVVVCEGEFVTLTATGAPTISWSPMITNGVQFQQAVGTVVYTATGTDQYGCESTDDVSVTVNPTPTVDAVDDQVLCNTETTLAVTFTGAVGGTTFDWTNTNPSIGLAANGTGNIGAFNATNGTTSDIMGTVNVTPSANGCIGQSINFQFTVHPTPTVSPILDQELCNGEASDQVNFMGTVANTSYNWTNSNVAIGLGASGTGNIAPFTATNTGSTTILSNITVTPVANGCSGAQEAFTITVYPTPTVGAVNDQELCANAATSAVNFNGTVTGTTFNWTNNNTSIGLSSPGAGNIASFNAVNNTNNTVTANVVVTPEANGCFGTPENFAFIVNPIPTVNNVNDQELCANTMTNQVAFSGSVQGTTYNWTNSNASIGLTTVGSGTIAAFQATNNGTADITGMIMVTPEADGCQGSPITFDILVHPIPNVHPLTSQTLCAGEGSTLVSITGDVVGTTFNWTNNNPSIGLNGTGSGDIASFNATNGGSSPIQGQVTVTPTSNGCSGQTQSMTFTVNPLPQATISGTTQLCLNSLAPTVTFTGSHGVAPYTFYYNINNGPTQTIVSSGNNATLTVPTSAAGVFNYNLESVMDNSTTACSQAQVGTATVTVHDLPVVEAGNDAEACIGDQVTLTATGASFYTWTPSISNGQPFVPSLGTTTYSVTGTDANGCVNTDQVNVTVHALPQIFAGEDQAICIGEEVTLNGSGAGTGGNYVWNPASVIDGQAFEPTQTGLYTVTGTDQFGCVSTDQVVVTVNPLPIISAGNNQAGCEGDEFILTGAGAGPQGTYTWDNGVTNGVPFAPPVGTTTYTVTGTNGNGCQNIAEVDIFIQSHPDVSFDFEQNGNCVPVTVTFTNTSTPANVTGCVWHLDDGSVYNGCGPFQHIFNEAGTYGASLYVETAENGCGAEVYYEDIIDVDGLPIASFEADPVNTTTIDTEVHFTNTSTNASNYEWTFGDGSSSTWINPTHEYTNEEAGVYYVTLVASTPQGCTDTAYTIINIDEELIFYVPNTFTPDDDKYNPYFEPVFTSGYDPFDYVLYIFNRWGEMVFESHDSSVGWDGTYGPDDNFNVCQDGVYTWVIEFKTTSTDERQRHVGHVNLLR